MEGRTALLTGEKKPQTTKQNNPLVFNSFIYVRKFKGKKPKNNNNNNKTPNKQKKTPTTLPIQQLEIHSSFGKMKMYIFFF